MANKTANKKMSFDESMRRLEGLMEKMEEASIDEMISTYAEAVQLLNDCKNKLDGYKAEFKRIAEDNKLVDIETEATE